jgi:hypothetical protein
VLLLIAIGNRWVPSPLPAGALQFVESLSFTKPNARDAAKMERSYYDGLMDVGRFNPELWSTLMQKPANWIEIGKSSAQRPRNDLLEFELVPSKATPINGVLFTTNRWGMRDRDYPLVKPAGTYRVALLGSSHLMGYEIADDLTFENLVEKRLKSPPPHAAQPHYELMNFGVYYYSAVKQALLLEQKVLAFKPDAVIMFSHSIESEWCINHLADVCRNRTPIKQQYLQDVLKRAGAKPEMSQAELRRRLNPFGDEVVRWAYAKMVRTCRENGIRPIWVFLPMAVRPEVPATVDRYVRWAGEAGFLTLDLRGIYQGYDRRTLQVAAWDDLHPNVEGNRLIAEKLYKVFTTDPRFGFVVAPGRDEGQKAKDAVSTGKD